MPSYWDTDTLGYTETQILGHRHWDTDTGAQTLGQAAVKVGILLGLGR